MAKTLLLSNGNPTLYSYNLYTLSGILINKSNFCMQQLTWMKNYVIKRQLMTSPCDSV